MISSPQIYIFLFFHLISANTNTISVVAQRACQQGLALVDHDYALCINIYYDAINKFWPNEILINHAPQNIS
jgi:hypothetical protein